MAHMTRGDTLIFIKNFIDQKFSEQKLNEVERIKKLDRKTNQFRLKTGRFQPFCERHTKT